MNKNKGFIGIGLILAIILGIVVVGGGAYYLGSNNSKQEVKVEENTNVGNNSHEVPTGPFLDETNYVAPKPIVDNQTKLNTYDSKTFDYSIGYSGIDTNKVYVTGDGKNINLFQNQSNIDTLEVVDSTYVVPNYVSSVGTVKFGLNQYKKFKDNTTSRNIYYLISGLQNNKSIWIIVENDSDTPNYLDLASLKINTINSVVKNISTALPTKYLGSQNWPPVVKTSGLAYSCKTSSGFGDVPTVVEEKNINGKKYCITSLIDAGVGSRFGEYTYITANGSGIKTTSFKLQWSSCGGYGGPGDIQYDECMITVPTFLNNLDIVVDSLM